MSTGKQPPADGLLGAADGPPVAPEPAAPEPAAPEPISPESAAPEPVAPEPAASSLGRLAATVDRLAGEVRAAHAAAEGRALVEMAKGVLIERLGCGPVHAARQLSELADRAGVSQLELAADIVDQAAQDRIAEVARDFVARTSGSTDASKPDPPLAVRLRIAESGALAANDTQAVAQSLLQHALAPLGATAVAVWAADADGSLTLCGHAGFSPDEAVRWRYVPPGVATVARSALGRRASVWLRSLAEAGIPSVGLHEHPGGRAAVLAGTGGRIHGVLEICWPHPKASQPPRIHRQFEALAELCAHTLEATVPHGDLRDGPVPALAELARFADGLRDSALVLVPHVGPDGNLDDFRIHHANRNFADPAGRTSRALEGALFLEAYPLAAGDGALFGHIERVYATGEQFQRDGMPLTALVDEVRLTAVADIGVSRLGGAVLLVWRLEDEVVRLAGLLQHAQRLGRLGGFEENLATGEITWNSQMFDLHGLTPTASPIRLEELPGRAHPDDAASLRRFLRGVMHHWRPGSAAFRLQRPDGVTRHIRVVAEPVLGPDGRLHAIRGALQDISAQHWTEVALAATRDQLAHTEQQAAARNRLTLQLQHAIMPPETAPLDTPALELAVRYRPAESESAVGGDWYDAVVLPDKQILISVGDVAGHGIGAATSMVVLRNALRGLAVTGAGPAQLLTWLNIVTHSLAGQVTATVVCGLYDPRRRVLRWARAGHLPPVQVREHDAKALPFIDGILLGALADAAYVEDEVQLRTGDTVLMFTDGLIERRDRTVQDSLAQLLANARGTAQSLDLYLDRLLTHSAADTDDDTCIVGFRVV
ncbi:SpoIIE family protein phosphatase [Yinghuangia sp. YIM S10712]|uniref:SpoIIE family protein phosphatase n=1 Tax=Yinghuangia sp. YIM S10712 TaxID=3436930 RepID=UPI003F52D1C3